ncbi:MAG: tRNA (adenosine(37)-N6)-dimethylallyltransferase MiaA [Acidobacteria bacterium]|nr:MAG: tRNA (adenosine(37)-N6)-dimethylallyltransferase MiaA [Acidobacteriota bacterium]
MPREGSRIRLVAVLGPTATGKSALALAIAERFGGEIVNCDSTAVYRGFDIGTDKIAAADRRGIPHHLIDIVEPTEEYTAAQFARDAAAAIRGIHARGRLPILAGGTGFYFRALTRGLFPGPGADPALRRRLDSIAMRRGVAFLHRMLRRFDAALDVLATALRLPAAQIAARVARRVDDQFARGLLDEIRGLLARGVPETARPFGGLVYRQALEHLHGLRDEAATRALITQENRRYARRQLIWFRKEPNLIWVDGPGESAPTVMAVMRLIEDYVARP